MQMIQLMHKHEARHDSRLPYIFVFNNGKKNQHKQETRLAKFMAISVVKTWFTMSHKGQIV